MLGNLQIKQILYMLQDCDAIFMTLSIIQQQFSWLKCTILLVKIKIGGNWRGIALFNTAHNFECKIGRLYLQRSTQGSLF